jgi:hypothetical protein
MNQSSATWGPLEPLAQEVAKNKIDGFCLSHELIHYVQKTWPNGKPVVSYYVNGGVVFFVEGAYINYGYTVEKEFQHDLRQHQVRAKTAAGAISLGLARQFPEIPLYIQLNIPTLYTYIMFIAQAGDEAKQVQETLKTLFPEATLNILDRPPRVLDVSEIPNFIQHFKKINTFSPGQKRIFINLAILAGICSVFSLLAFFGTIFSIISTIAFVLFVAYFILVLGQLSNASVDPSTVKLTDLFKTIPAMIQRLREQNKKKQP